LNPKLIEDQIKEVQQAVDVEAGAKNDGKEHDSEFNRREGRSLRFVRGRKRGAPKGLLRF
jgi:hypothetical protein